MALSLPNFCLPLFSGLIICFFLQPLLQELFWGVLLLALLSEDYINVSSSAIVADIPSIPDIPSVTDVSSCFSISFVVSACLLCIPLLLSYSAGKVVSFFQQLFTGID